MYDLVIIGASAASFPAAIYAARRNLNFIILTKNIGGELALSGEVNNWPGTKSINGFELARQFHEHAKSYGVTVKEGIEVSDIKQTKNYHAIIARDAKSQEKIYETKTVLIASGIHPRILGIKGEENLKGKGVTYCTVCDGPLFKRKITATIGSGNSALESALMMSNIAKKVYILTKYSNTAKDQNGFPKGETILINKLKKLDNIEVIYNANSKEFCGGDKLESIIYEDTGTKEKKELKIDGAMVHIGTVPNSNFINCVQKNKQKEIEINLKCETSCPGIFAAGDVTNVPYKQIIIAAGQGVTAALSVIGYLNKMDE